MGECERLCYEEHNCVSINFERKKNGDGKYHCELNNSTHGEHDQDLVDTENYFYRGTKVPLSKENAELSNLFRNKKSNLIQNTAFVRTSC